MIPTWAQKLPWDILYEIGEKEDVDHHLLAAFTMQESAGDQYAIRYEPNYQWLYQPNKFTAVAKTTLDTEICLQKFSYSYMQVMGSTARSLGFIGQFGEMFEPRNAFTYGARYLKKCLEKYSKLEDSISAYNAGSARKIDETRYVNDTYVRGVLFYLQEIK